MQIYSSSFIENVITLELVLIYRYWENIRAAIFMSHMVGVVNCSNAHGVGSASYVRPEAAGDVLSGLDMYW